MHLLINYYKCPNLDRRKEYDKCLEGNIKNNHIKQIHVFADNDENVPKHEKLKVYGGYGRITFDNMIGYGNSLTGIVIIANSDILFDDTLKHLPKFLKGKQVVALTRWEEKKDGKWKMLDRNDSQDVWAYVAPLKAIKDVMFLMGQRGCDNVLAGILAKYYHIRNPARTIVARHIHKSGYRTYGSLPIVKGQRHRVEIE